MTLGELQAKAIKTLATPISIQKMELLLPVPGCDCSYCKSKTSDIIKATESEQSQVDHPSHYGGKDNPYEAIKVIEAWGVGFNLGSVLKYISRCGKKHKTPIEDLEKARWYLDREIQNTKVAVVE